MLGTKIRASLLVAALGLAAFTTGAARAADAGTVTNGTVTSEGGTLVHYSLFKPNGADATHQVPMIFHSHGWGGSRSTAVADWNDWLADGFGVLSFDQRGHGESTATATVEDPEHEGQDVRALIDFVATLDWVQLDGPGDPVLGAVGGSYGGGYQTIGALTDLRDTGHTRFNAIAPEITWFDLPGSLAPQLVPRTLWSTLLYAVAPRNHARYIDEAEAYGLATTTFPDGTVPVVPNLKDIFYRHSPHWFSDHGYHLDIPVLFGQGITDNLFDLNQGLHNWSDVLTASARDRSIFVGYNSGHVLPEVLPPSTNPSGNPCVTNWDAFERAFFHAAFAGQNPRAALGGLKAFNIATSDNGCIRTDSITNFRTFGVKPLGSVVASAVVGAPVAYKIASGPLSIAGVAHLRGKLTTLGVDTRAFFALSVGTNPLTAMVIQNNVLPIRRLLPVVNESLDLELPGCAISVPAGQNLYLTVSPTASAFIGTSRVPGVMLIKKAVVDLPVQ
jgi:ABC-2 type transport system ATP-binding protein